MIIYPKTIVEIPENIIQRRNRGDGDELETIVPVAKYAKVTAIIQPSGGSGHVAINVTYPQGTLIVTELKKFGTIIKWMAEIYPMVRENIPEGMELMEPSNLVVNGDFSNGLNGWEQHVTGSSSLTVSNGNLRFACQNQQNFIVVGQQLILEVGAKYFVKWNIVDMSGSGNSPIIRIGIGDLNAGQVPVSNLTDFDVQVAGNGKTGEQQGVFRATRVNNRLNFELSNDPGHSGRIDDVSVVKLVE